LVYLNSEVGLGGRDDPSNLEAATDLRAVLVTQNQKDFSPLHHRWQAEYRRHAGILLLPHIQIGLKIQYLERAARLLTPEAAENQLMELMLFDTEESGLLYVASLTPLGP
jgi:hypothetical protein